MTQDVRLIEIATGVFDLVVVDSVLDTVDGFETAIMVSLLSDARASAANVLTPSKRRGWVANILTADTGRQYGSRLWTFHQARLTPGILNDISIAAQESLNWMVQDGIAKSVSTTAVKTGIKEVNIDINIITPTGTEERYAFTWRQTGAI